MMAHQIKSKAIRRPKKRAMARNIIATGIGPFSGRRVFRPKPKLAVPSEAATRRTINKALGKKN